MPIYNDINDVPDAVCLQTWGAFIDRLLTIGELQWLTGRIIRHDITQLRPENSPLLCVVKTADDWEKTATGQNPPYQCIYDFGMRLYLYDAGGAIPAIEARYDLIERANEVLVRVLRSDYMICHKPYWSQLYIDGGRPNSRTSVIDKVAERLSITTRFRLLREFRPGQ